MSFLRLRAKFHVSGLVLFLSTLIIQTLSFTTWYIYQNSGALYSPFVVSDVCLDAASQPTTREAFLPFHASSLPLMIRPIILSLDHHIRTVITFILIADQWVLWPMLATTLDTVTNAILSISNLPFLIIIRKSPSSIMKFIL